MKGAVMQVFLRRNIDKKRVQEIVRHIESHGYGEVSIEHYRGHDIIYLYDKRDIDVIKSKFGSLINAQMSLTT